MPKFSFPFDHIGWAWSLLSPVLAIHANIQNIDLEAIRFSIHRPSFEGDVQREYYPCANIITT